jgi:ubiquinone/menaquinone biosynthesis C-methylase UbiE
MYMLQARYDDIAEWYDESVRQGLLLHEFAFPPFYELIGDVHGLTVCDLACGQGVVARELAKRGAQVTGIDLSAKLLDIARKEEQREPRGIRYIQDDAQSLSSVGDTAFDLVVCNVALMDIPDITATFQAVQRVLRQSGHFVFSITHPCFLPPDSHWTQEENGAVGRFVSHYFEEIYWRSDNAHGVRGKVGAHHRTLSTYLNSLIEAGLCIERLVEPSATGAIAERSPGFIEVAALLLVKAKKM